MNALSLKRLPLPSVDTTLMAAGLMLLTWGLVMVASSSVASAEKLTDAPLYYFFRQLAFAGIGLCATMIALCVPMRAWEKSGFMLVAFSLFLLVLVLLRVWAWRSIMRAAGSTWVCSGCRPPNRRAWG